MPTLITTGKLQDELTWKKYGWLFIDTTARSAKGNSKALAPPWNLVLGWKKRTISNDEYRSQYIKQLTDSQQQQRKQWENTIQRYNNIVFACLCATGKFCHRTLLAKEFVHFGEEEMGLGDIVFIPEDGNIPPAGKKTEDKPTDGPTITSFRGEHGFLSNFTSVNVKYDGVTYSSTEAAFQAAKTLNKLERELIRKETTPGKAKRAGRRVTLRSDWNDIRDKVMFELSVQKYTRSDLRKKLLATGNRELVEKNSWKDFYWGVCDGRGENRLGKILMAIRSSLR